MVCGMMSDHPWIREDGEASDKPLDSTVINRMKQFRAMNKLKKVALKVLSIPSHPKKKKKFSPSIPSFTVYLYIQISIVRMAKMK